MKLEAFQIEEWHRTVFSLSTSHLLLLKLKLDDDASMIADQHHLQLTFGHLNSTCFWIIFLIITDRITTYHRFGGGILQTWNWDRAFSLFRFRSVMCHRAWRNGKDRTWGRWHKKARPIQRRKIVVARSGSRCKRGPAPTAFLGGGFKLNSRTWMSMRRIISVFKFTKMRFSTFHHSSSTLFWRKTSTRPEWCAMAPLNNAQVHPWQKCGCIRLEVDVFDMLFMRLMNRHWHSLY